MNDIKVNPITEETESNGGYGLIEGGANEILADGYEYEYEYVEVFDDESESPVISEMDVVSRPRIEDDGSLQKSIWADLDDEEEKVPLLSQENSFITQETDELSLDDMLGDVKAPRLDSISLDENYESFDVTKKLPELFAEPVKFQAPAAEKMHSYGDTTKLDDIVGNRNEASIYEKSGKIHFSNDDVLHGTGDNEDWFAEMSGSQNAEKELSVDSLLNDDRFDRKASIKVEDYLEPKASIDVRQMERISPEFAAPDEMVERDYYEVGDMGTVGGFVNPEAIINPSEVAVEYDEDHPETVQMFDASEIAEEYIEPIAEAEPEPVIEEYVEEIAEVEPETVIEEYVEPIAEAEPETVIEEYIELIAEVEPETVIEEYIEPVAEAEPEMVIEEYIEPVAEAEPEMVIEEYVEPVAVESPVLVAETVMVSQRDVEAVALEQRNILPQVQDYSSAEIEFVSALRSVSKKDGIQSFRGASEQDKLVLMDVDFAANELSSWNLVLMSQQIQPLKAKVSEINAPQNGKLNRVVTLVKNGEQKASFFNENNVKIINATDACVAVDGKFVCGDFGTNSGLIIDDYLTISLSEFAGKKLCFNEPARGILCGPNGSLLYFADITEIYIPNHDMAEIDVEKLQYKISKWYSGTRNDKYFEFSANSPSTEFIGNEELKAIHVNVNSSSYGWNVTFDDGLSMNLRDLREYQTRFGKMPSANGVISYGQTKLTFRNTERVVVYESAQYFFYS